MLFWMKFEYKFYRILITDAAMQCSSEVLHTSTRHYTTLHTAQYWVTSYTALHTSLHTTAVQYTLLFTTHYTRNSKQSTLHTTQYTLHTEDAGPDTAADNPCPPLYPYPHFDIL